MTRYCDVCNKKMNKSVTIRVEDRTGEYEEIEYYDMCEKCLNTMKAWIHGHVNMTAVKGWDDNE